MKYAKQLSVILLAFVLYSCNEVKERPNMYDIIPLPLEMVEQEGRFTLNSSTKVYLPANDAERAKAANHLINRFAVASGIQLATEELPDNTDGLTNAIIIKPLYNSEFGKEGYTLSVANDRITIASETGQGAFYAIQSIIQLLPPEILSSKKEKTLWTVPSVEIKDKPRFAYRGLHLDVCRHFSNVEEVKRYIDMLALHKMNSFHWHLTDDQGWRIEIKKYPKLAEVGGKRKETLVGSYYDEYPQVFDGKEYGPFYYTQEEIKEVVAYAAERFVNIIPEVELPGHAMAALAAYPELACTEGPFDVQTKWGIFKEVFCPKEETFTFLEDVLAEVIELFPSPIIHIGGDECPKDRWKECPHCQALMKKEGLKDENELQSYFVQRIEKFVNSKGRNIIGWDEILEGGLAPNAAVMSWRGVKGGIAAAQQKHPVVMTPAAFAYLDYYDYDPYLCEEVRIFGYVPLEKTYSFDPTPEDLTAEEAKYILGVQGNIWREYSPTHKDTEFRVFPRALAIAEIGWTSKERKDYYGFAHRLKAYMKHLDVYGLTYSKRMFDINAMPEYDAESNTLAVTLDNQYDPTAIRYTVDGSEPTENSIPYTIPINISGRRVIKAAVFENGKPVGRIFEREYVGHKALGMPCTLNDGTEVTIPVNGLRENIYENPGWRPKPAEAVRGEAGSDLVLVVNLKESQPVKKVTACLINQPIYTVAAPIEIVVAYSADGVSYTDAAKGRIENKEPNHRRHVEGGIELQNVTAQYLKVTLKNAGSPFPAGSTNEGKPSVIMLDELIVE